MIDCVCGGSPDNPNPDCERCQLVARHNQMSDCLDDIRIILEVTDYKSALNRLQAIRERINFDIPENV